MQIDALKAYSPLIIYHKGDGINIWESILKEHDIHIHVINNFDTINSSNNDIYDNCKGIMIISPDDNGNIYIHVIGVYVCIYYMCVCMYILYMFMHVNTRIYARRCVYVCFHIYVHV